MRKSPLTSFAAYRSRILNGLVPAARAALVWERAWPRIALAGTVLLLFLGLSWFDVWPAIGPKLRFGSVAIFAIAFLAALLPLARLARPSQGEALTRIDRSTGLPHRPATTLADRLSAGQDDPLTRAFWDLHRRDATRNAHRLRPGLPSPNLPYTDPWALRFAVVLMAIVGFVSAGDQRASRIAAAFDWTTPGAETAPPRLDAWITPPPYTGRAPIFLTAGTHDAIAPEATIEVPANSMIVARTSGGEAEVRPSGGLVMDKVPPEDAAPDAVREWTFRLEGDGALDATPQSGESHAWRFTALPDQAPHISFTEPPKSGPRGQTVLSYRMSDDYGVTSAEAFVQPRDVDEAMSPLVDPPKIPLVLPQRRGGGEAVASQDLLSHPWAGSDVRIILEARDAGDNTGRSAATEMTLPQRSFRNPLARAIVDQRRALALDIGARGRVERTLDALALYPERFTPKAPTYLALRSIYWRLKNAAGTEDLRAVIDYMWQVALRMEDGDMTDIERDLKAAQEALKEALERGAPEDEIRKLTEDLRQALNTFLAEMARRAQNAQRMPPGSMPPNMQMVRPDDLMRMLDRLQEFSVRGANQAAQDMLSELNRILEGINPNATAQMDPMSEEMAKMLDELGRMIREQNELRDRTFQEGQGGGQPQDENSEQGGHEGRQGSQNLAQDQNALRQRLQDLMERLQEQGLDGGKELGQAGEEMGSAGDQLGQGNAPGAVGPQGRALDALRQGAQGLAQQMMGQGNEPGQNGQPGNRGGNQHTGQRGFDDEVDPLGRPTRTRRFDPGSSVRVPGEIDAQRARRVLEELRRRLSDPNRPAGELDYLERLIEP